MITVHSNNKTAPLLFGTPQATTKLLILHWDRSPLAAIQMLEVAAEHYPLEAANKLVQDVVSEWRKKSSHVLKVNGSDDHFLLAACALTANGDLVDRELFDKQRENVSSRYGSDPDKKDGYWSNCHDIETKITLLREYMDTGTAVSLAGYYKAKDFNSVCQLLVPDFGEINAELIAYFANHPEQLQILDWRKFEELLNAVFKNQGYYTELGPGSGDGGVDIRLIQKDSIGEILTLVQAKRYRETNPIDLQAIQALHGVVDDQMAHRGLFVTTSRYLPSAQNFAKRQNGRLILANSMDVAAWCKLIISK